MASHELCRDAQNRGTQGLAIYEGGCLLPSWDSIGSRNLGLSRSMPVSSWLVRSHHTPPPSRSERRLCGLVCKETRHRGQGGHAAWQGARTTTPSARCCHMTAQLHNATIANLVLFLAVNGTGSCHGNRLCSCAGPHMYLDDATLVNSDGVGLTRVVRGSNKS